MLYEFCRVIIIFIVKVFFGFKVEGKGSIPRDSSFILAANHLSNLDPIVLGAASPVRVYFLAKRELFKNKYFAFFIKSVGAIPLDRGKSDIAALRNAIRILKNDKPIVIFPQGRRSAVPGKPLGGVGFLFKKTHRPIVLAKITGTDRALPKGCKMIRFSRITVSFRRMDDPLGGVTYNEIAFRVWENIKNMRPL